MNRRILHALLLVFAVAAKAEAAFFSPELRYDGWLGDGSYVLITATVFLTPDSGWDGGELCFASTAGQVYAERSYPRPDECTFPGWAWNGTSVTVVMPAHGGRVTFVATNNGRLIASRTWGADVGPLPPPPPPPRPPRRESPGHPGAAPVKPRSTDTTFVASVQPSCRFPSQGPIRIEVPITRVVGEVDADGNLVEPVELMRRGVVSTTTRLEIPAFDVDSDGGLPAPAVPEHDLVYVNGRHVGRLTGANNQWAENTLSVPTEYLRFGTRRPGQAPAPGINEIEIRVDQANEARGQEFYCAAVGWAALHFDALAPTIMVHGNNSSGEFFGNWFNAAGEQIGFDFIQAFRRERLPFDNSISMPTASVAAHADYLRTRIPELAAEFGARHVHIVAHSKGGLDVRKFLEGPLPADFGVLSLTTLATPHHGSVGADYALDARNAAALWSDNARRTLLVQTFEDDAGRSDLRVSAVERFNDNNLSRLPRQMTVDGETRPVVYMAVSADANLDRSRAILGWPTIGPNEIRGIPLGGVPAFLMPDIMTFVYRTMGEVQSTVLEYRPIPDEDGGVILVPVVREISTPSFQLNDFLVTVNSARIDGFRLIASSGDNHATVANPANGYVVVAAIKHAQRLDEHADR